MQQLHQQHLQHHMLPKYWSVRPSFLAAFASSELGAVDCMHAARSPGCDWPSKSRDWRAVWWLHSVVKSQQSKCFTTWTEKTVTTTPHPRSMPSDRGLSRAAEFHVFHQSARSFLSCVSAIDIFYLRPFLCETVLIWQQISIRHQWISVVRCLFCFVFLSF